MELQPLTPEQKHVFDKVVEAVEKGQSPAIGGYAGTGKTILASHLTKRFPGFAVVAPTGKAAEVLRRKGIEADTIHSKTYRPDIDPKTKLIRKNKDGEQIHIPKTSSEVNCSGFLIDEASMVGDDVVKHLESYGKPIIWIGDHGQLPPVKGNLNIMSCPDYRLETIHRNAGDIANFAAHLRSNLPPQEFPLSRDVEIIDGQRAREILEHDPNRFDIQCICGKNKSRVALNNFLRGVRGAISIAPEIGDRIISLKNHRPKLLSNGTQVEIKALFTKDKLSYEIDGATYKIAYNPTTFGNPKPDDIRFKHPFDYAYCVSCHKAQGSEWDTVMVFTYGGKEYMWLDEPHRWAYTAASRAMKKLYWVI